MMAVPEDYTEFQLQWSAKGKELATLSEIIVLIETKSAEAFVRHRDDIANALRDLTKEVSRRENKARSELTEFVNADQTRRLEFLRLEKLDEHFDYRNEKGRAEHDRLLEIRDQAQAALEAFNQRRRDITSAILAKLESKASK